MKSMVSIVSLTLLTISLTVGCSHKSLSNADAAITPSDSNPPVATKPKEDGLDKNALARIVNSDGKEKVGKKKSFHKHITKIVEAPKAAPVVAAAVIPPAPAVETPKEPVKAVEANPEMGGFLVNHWPFAAMLGMLGLGSMYFFALWKKKEENK